MRRCVDAGRLPLTRAQSPDRPSRSRTSSLQGIQFRRPWESQLSGDLSAPAGAPSCTCSVLEVLGPRQGGAHRGPLLRRCALGSRGPCLSPSVPVPPQPRGDPAPLARRASRMESPAFSALHACAQPPNGSGPFRSWPAARSPGGHRHSRPCPELVTRWALQLAPPGPGLTHSQSLPGIPPCGSTWAPPALNVTPCSAQTPPLLLRRASLGLWLISHPTGCMASRP